MFIRSLLLFPLLYAPLFAAPPLEEAPKPKVGKSDAAPPVPKTEPSITISGVKEVAPYKLQRLKVDGVPTGYTILWDVYPLTGLDAATQKTKGVYEFVIPPGTYKARVRAFKGEDILETWFDFTVTGKPVDPIDPVDPVVPPKPKPDGKFGLIKVSREGYAVVTVPMGVKTVQAKALAGSNKAFASAVAAGGQPDPSTNSNTAKAVLTAWGTANADALTEAFGRTEDWKPWADAVAKAFFAAWTSGKLKTKQDWVDAFNEIAIGLE